MKMPPIRPPKIAADRPRGPIERRETERHVRRQGRRSPGDRGGITSFFACRSATTANRANWAAFGGCEVGRNRRFFKRRRDTPSVRRKPTSSFKTPYGSERSRPKARDSNGSPAPADGQRPHGHPPNGDAAYPSTRVAQQFKRPRPQQPNSRTDRPLDTPRSTGYVP